MLGDSGHLLRSFTQDELRAYRHARCGMRCGAPVELELSFYRFSRRLRSRRHHFRWLCRGCAERLEAERAAREISDDNR